MQVNRSSVRYEAESWLLTSTSWQRRIPSSGSDPVGGFDSKDERTGDGNRDAISLTRVSILVPERRSDVNTHRVPVSVPLLTCWPVLTEAVWLLRKKPTALDKLFSAFDAGLIDVLSLDANAVAWTAAFLQRYETIGADLPDAALVYLAERENIRTVFTLDRRDFSVYRLKRNRTLKLLPEVQ